MRLLPAILSCLVSSAWAAEVSDSLKKLNTIYHATTFVYNYLGVVAGKRHLGIPKHLSP